MIGAGTTASNLYSTQAARRKLMRVRSLWYGILKLTLLHNDERVPRKHPVSVFVLLIEFNSSATVSVPGLYISDRIDATQEGTMIPVLYTLLLGFIRQATGIPIGGTVDSSSDTWASTLSDIGPLILLVGERTTKQLLCNVHGLAPAFSLATAPLGLVSVVSSLLRLAGSQTLRSFLGYELESRTVAAMELTRVNCNGVHAELVDGHLVRSTATLSDSHVGAIGALMLQGSIKDHAEDVAKQVESCRRFGERKARFHVPETEAALRWCLQVKLESYDEVLLVNVFRVLRAALGLEASCVNLESGVREYWKGCFKSADEDSSPAATSGKSKESRMPQSGYISFLCTFDAISEFCTGADISQSISILIGTSAFLIIVALYLLELAFANKWQLTVGFLLALVGYTGIVTSVVAAALQIHSTARSIPLPRNFSPAWRDGVVIAASSDSKLGVVLHHSLISKRPLAFEAVWLKPLTRRNRALANGIGIALTASFLCHYMGLRSSSWWLGASELAVCVVMAFLRSLNRGGPENFVRSDEGPRLEWRCTSTGIITVEDPLQLPPSVRPAFGGLDIRVYSDAPALGTPAPAEKLAWHLAGLCLQDKPVIQWLKSITGMRVFVNTDNPSSDKRALLVCYMGGVLVKEGIAAPNTIVNVAFRSSIENLAAPTGLLLRGIMRQQSWKVEPGALDETITALANVHIPALHSLVTWWTVSELRNTLKDNQENLQWAALPILTRFFACIREMYARDKRLLEGLTTVHDGRGEDVKELAIKLYTCWKKESDDKN